VIREKSAVPHDQSHRHLLLARHGQLLLGPFEGSTPGF
jgi:hypothetical protein